MALAPPGGGRQDCPGLHNCVFVGRDPEGKARYTCIRGIRNPYKGEVKGSDKRVTASSNKRRTAEPQDRVLMNSPSSALLGKCFYHLYYETGI